MKLQSDKTPAPLTSGGLQVHNVGISDDPEDQLMILNVLSNTLYTDKVSAVLREYGCNAADANVEAGRGSQPIEVRLPTKLDPTVSIRDFGFGMTEQQILETFIKLGRSTKRNSNAFTGMLGIGSKAGFAYGDSFLVTSFTGGQQTVYNLYRDRGAPKLAQMFQSATDSPDGVEIKVPVRVEDMMEFVDKAKQVFSYFKVRPIIHGAKIEWVKRDELFSGLKWRYTGNQRAVAIMGNVAYKLDAAAMGLGSANAGSYNANYNSPSKEETLIGLGVELDFKIGDLEISANREGLQYSDTTKAALKKALNGVAAEIGSIFTKKIASATSMWEARKWYHDNFEHLDNYNRYSLKKLVTGQIVWNGETINNGKFYLGNREADTEVSVTQFTRGGRRYSGSSPGAFRVYPNAEDVTATKAVSFIENDTPTKKHSPSRIRQWFVSHPECTEIVQFTFGTSAAKARYWKLRQLEGVVPVLLSSITPLVSTSVGGTSAPSIHKSKHAAKVFTLNESKVGDWGTAKSSWWQTVEVDLQKDSGVYVRINGFLVHTPGGLNVFDESPYSFHPKVVRLRKAGLIQGPVYGFKPDRIAKLGPNWKLLDVSIAEQFDRLCTKQAFKQELADAIHAQGYQPLMPLSARKQFADGTSMRKLLDEYDRMIGPAAHKELRSLVFGGSADPWLKKPAMPKASFDLKAQESAVLTDYPLLKHVPVAHLQQAGVALTKNVVDYIKLVESH